MIVVDPESLKETIATVLRAAGADERNVAIVAEHLKGAELCGVQTHGIFQIPHYIDEIARKELIPPPGRRSSTTEAIAPPSPAMSVSVTRRPISRSNWRSRRPESTA